MSNPNELSRGNIISQWALAVTLSPTTCSATTTTLQTFTVTGLQIGDIVGDVTTQVPIVATGGLGIINSRVSAANTLQLEYMNPTNGTLTPVTNTTYFLVVSRPVNLTSGTSLPVSTLNQLV